MIKNRKDKEYIEKKMYFANFNITFGKDSEPMLYHFFDIIYPAMTNGYVRESPNKTGMTFLLSDICLQEIDENVVLTGNYIKNMIYNVNTSMEHGELAEKNLDVPTSPYSRFIIFLKNHRMVLIKNESASPDIRSFQAHFRNIIDRYIHTINIERDKNNKLPVANINIVDMPFEEEIYNTLKTAKKIEWVNFKFFPLNADISPVQFAEDIDKKIKEIESTSANIKFNSPKSIKPIIKNIQETSGLAIATLSLLNNDGSKSKIKEGQFKSSMDVTYNGNIKQEVDGYFIDQAKKNQKMLITSDENAKIYKRFKSRLQNLTKR